MIPGCIGQLKSQRQQVSGRQIRQLDALMACWELRKLTENQWFGSSSPATAGKFGAKFMNRSKSLRLALEASSLR